MAAAIALCSCGCVSIAGRTLPDDEIAAPVETTISDSELPDTTTAFDYEGVGGDLLPDITEQTEAVFIDETYSTYEFDDEDKIFLDNCIFVGDSVCKGLSHYGVVPVANTLALGGVAARNIFEFAFDAGDGTEVDLLTALVNANKASIVFFMGMNDVRMTTEDTYASNYKDLLTKTEAACPYSNIYVFSTSPLAADSDFTTNDHIAKYNAAVKQMIEDSGNVRWKYVDIDPELTNSAGYLKSDYSGGDGLHLAQSAYYAILWQFCQQR